MAYVDIYKAVRSIMRAGVGWIGLDLSQLSLLANNPDFQNAVAKLRRAIKSPVVDVTVVADGKRRQIAAYERDYHFDFWQGTLMDPFGGPPLLSLLICTDGIKRLAASPAIAPGQLATPAIEHQRFAGRPSVKRQIIGQMQKRFAAGEACKSVADEARWLLRWAQDQYPNDTSVPTKPTSVENSIREEFRRLEAGPLNTPIK